MTGIVLRSGHLPDAQRLGDWRRLARDSVLPTELRTDRPEQFTGTLRCYRLGLITGLGVTCGALTADRPAALIAAADPRCHQLLVPRRGLTSLELDGRYAECGPGTLLLGTTSRPSTLRTHPDPGGTASVTGLLVPRELVPLPEHATDGLLATALPADQGPGALLAQLVHRLDEDADHYRAVHADRLETVVLDLFRSFLAHHLGSGTAPTAESRRRTLYLRARELVLRDLHDPALTPDHIAAALHISTRYLYRLFQEHQRLPVRAWIRAERLERCARALADPAEHATPLNELALRWGFTHPAAFTRAFREAYGLPPYAYRRAHLPPYDDPYDSRHETPHQSPHNSR
ncbi:helix-turn-helix domain-containing protein [Streptomyces sp. NA04227]|uniref:helix-turn-helix domain-containing protein n=1 Tax=Streptomyces sp. NA04227 TaxID=2742136 RepID=UPI001590CFAF|nr:helix-turn-helix domain-containing protein [Streptomyces sp. NA04227]QKW09171.1 helix-turn-helix domain-containing protein [Streptomyces sp. NA04227]